MKILTYIITTAIMLSAYGYAAGYIPVKEIKISGLERTSRFVVESKIKHRPGEPFSEELWISEKYDLLDLDLFANVELVVTDTMEGSILEYRFKELPLFIVFPAMKRTDQDGLLMGPGLTYMNLFGAGIHQEILGRFTVVPEPLRAKDFLSYTSIPDVFGLDMTCDLTVNYFSSYNSLKLYNENSVYSVADFIFMLPADFSLILAVSTVNVKHDSEAATFTAENITMEMFPGNGTWDYVPGAGAGIVLDTRERAMNPHRGFYAEARYSIYGEKLGGDADYSEYIADFRGYLPAGSKHIIHLSLLGRYRPGTIPAYELYHAGGVNSLRTFEPDPEICGQHEFLGTLEYRYELFTGRQVSLMGIDAWYGLQLVAGMDNAVEWLPGQSAGDGRYYNSFYAGIHLLVPALERVRLEFGFNTNEPGERKIRLGINLGWYEKSCTQRRRVR